LAENLLRNLSAIGETTSPTSIALRNPINYAQTMNPRLAFEKAVVSLVLILAMLGVVGIAKLVQFLIGKVG
jgi:hypothetical protein